MQKIKTLLSFIVIFCAFFVFTACPSRSDVKRGFELSAKISGVGTQATIAVGDLFTSGVITFEQKEKIISALRKVQENGKRFNAVLSELKNRYGNNPPDEELKAIDVFFNREIIAPFVEVLVEAGTLSADKAEKVYLVIAGIKQIIFTISNIFGKFSSDSVSFRESGFIRENYAV